MSLDIGLFQGKFMDEFKNNVLVFYRIIGGPDDMSRACLYWSIAVVMAAEKMGLPDIGWEFQLQAGTASWRRTDEDSDDNAFAYEYETKSSNMALVANNTLPEMHCWVACAKNGVIFDITTEFVEINCIRGANKSWERPRLPDYMIFRSDTVPEGVFYAASLEATGIAYHFATKIMDRI